MFSPWPVSAMVIIGSGHSFLGEEDLLRVAIVQIELPMKKFGISRLILFIFLGRLLVVSFQAGLSEGFWTVQNQTASDNVKGMLNGKQMTTDRKVALEHEKYAVDAYNSGIRGTTTSTVMTGIPGGRNTERPMSIEFAIAPIAADDPVYHRAIFVRSDQYGKYGVALSPGRYWIGPKAKALDPVNYRPSATSFSEKVVIVKEGTFTQIDLSEVRYAP